MLISIFFFFFVSTKFHLFLFYFIFIFLHNDDIQHATKVEDSSDGARVCGCTKTYNSNVDIKSNNNSSNKTN